MCTNPVKSESKKIKEENENNNESSTQQGVKSTAVVKYSAVLTPANFAQLQCNTDLNLPPSNWLSSSAESYGLQHVLSHSTGFCSFRMAHMFPDCMGEVDVISDAENVKKLLKIPYSRSPVSMMVHRIENTLLIDEFDIHKHLLRQAENDWVWLRKFFHEHVMQSLNEKEKSVILKNNSRYALLQKSLVSKFLHHSLVKPSTEPSKDDSSEQTEASEQQNKNQPEEVSQTSKYLSREKILPEPRLEEKLPDPTINHKFARNVVWTFEDIQMLLGIDMPIFGGSTHPCISLRLRDVAKPISVLTGIDYWLDNLMCNVPEVVMCYHLDGIVQRYELIKTEDLPTMPDSKFSPKLIRDVAQNILSFLKSNATKAGHTYWLFKGKDEEVVKLYDLTSLCSEGLIEKGQNPFTVPVAMLLYRVARNMKHNSSSQPGTIRMLLKNCLSLLPKEKYPQIVTSAHYMLSDLYVPVNTDPASPGFNDQETEVSEDIGGESDRQSPSNPEDDDSNIDEENETAAGCDDSEATNTVAVKSLCVSNLQHHSSGRGSRGRHYKYSDGSTAPPPLVGSIEDRCQMALQHVAEGLQCLQYFEGDKPAADKNSNNSGGSSSTGVGQTEEAPKMARPFQPIPMPYSTLKDKKEKQSSKDQRSRPQRPGSKHNKKNKKSSAESSRKNSEFTSEEITSPRALLCKPQAEALPTWQQPENMDNASWNAHLKTLLYEKACLVYTILSEQYYNTERYASALRYISNVLKCSCHMVGAYYNLVSFLLGRAGDCCFQLAKHWSKSDLEAIKAEFVNCSEVDRLIASEMDRDSHCVNYIEECYLIPESLNDIEQLLLCSYRCYDKALKLSPSDNLRRRLGNIHNEIGSFHINQASIAIQLASNTFTKEQFEEIFKTAMTHLEQGIEQFESVKDNVNLALLYSNRGRLMRLMAHYHSSNEGFPLTKSERQFYNKALGSYQTALNAIGSRKVNPVIWDTINWELSTALYTLATLSQDYPLPFLSKSKEEAEREVADMLLKALKQCDLDTPGPRQPVYQFRAASLHHRLGSLYHKMLRSMANDDAKRKNVLQLCQLNYDKATRLLLALEHPPEYLRVQLEKVALAEFQAESTNSVHSKVKVLQGALDILLQCRSMLEYMAIPCTANAAKSGSAAETVPGEEGASLDKEKVNKDSNDGQDKDDSSKLPRECTCKYRDESVVEKEQEEEKKLVDIMEQRLQFILKTLLKLSITHSQARISQLSTVYKEAYAALLKKTEDKEDSTIDSKTRATIAHILTVFDKLKST